jgi:hypothetical protein
MSLPRELVESVGGFDTNFRGWGLEDLEFAYRLFVGSGRRKGLFVFDRSVFAFHLLHFSDWSRKAEDAVRNLRYLKAKHRRFDVELFSGDNHLGTEYRVAHYEEVLNQYRATGLGVAPDALLRAIPRGARTLIVGARKFPVEHFHYQPVVYDHCRPPTAENTHMLGIATGMQDRTLDAVIHVDLWRYFIPTDVSGGVCEGLRIADSVYLVATSERERLSRSPADMSYVAAMLEEHHDVARLSVGGATILHVKRRNGS